METKAKLTTAAFLMMGAPYLLDTHSHLDLPPKGISIPDRLPIEATSTSSATASDVFTPYFFETL
jgi:hypothetical protein